MDSFIDKFTQRKNAQEMIRANAMAEAEEKKRMEARLAEYEQAMQEMRRCSLLNLENAEKVKETLAASLAKIEQVQKKDEPDRGKTEKSAEEVKILLEKLTEQVTKTLEAELSRTEELLAAQTKTIEELIHASDEFDHKEAVKVYRNVQAVIEEALPKQTEAITAAVKNAEGQKKTPTGSIILWVLTFGAAAANVAIEVLRILGYL